MTHLGPHSKACRGGGGVVGEWAWVLLLLGSRVGAWGFKDSIFIGEFKT